MSGLFSENASPFAKFTPTSRAPMSPGAYVTAIASISAAVFPAFSRASFTTPIMLSQWRRLAISGTTPPYNLCSSICVATTELIISLPSRMIAAAVSSQELSIARISISFVLFSKFWCIYYFTSGLRDVRNSIARSMELRTCSISSLCSLPALR